MVLIQLSLGAVGEGKRFHSDALKGGWRVGLGWSVVSKSYLTAGM